MGSDPLREWRQHAKHDFSPPAEAREPQVVKHGVCHLSNKAECISVEAAIGHIYDHLLKCARTEGYSVGMRKALIKAPYRLRYVLRRHPQFHQDLGDLHTEVSVVPSGD